MGRVYLDSSAIIYAIEGETTLQHRVGDLLQQQSDAGPVEIFVSRLSLLECRVKPMRDGRHDVLAKHDAFFAKSDLAIIEINAEVIDRATQLRAEHGFKTADAIHLASALTMKSDLFVTGDKQLKRCPGLHVETISG